jgi:uncharacterized membrane protein YccC
MIITARKYKSELQLVVRALVAAALSLFVGELLALPQSFWAVITALIIVQGSVGGTLTAGLNRLLGTLAGAVLGAAAVLARELWHLPQMLLLLVAVAPVALLAAIRPSFRVAPITAAIVLFTNNGASPIASATDRVVEISLGTFIGVVVSILVFPSRAKRISFQHAAEVLKLLAQVLTLYLQPPVTAKLEAIDRLNGQVRAELAKVEAAAQEADREHAIRLAGEPVPDRLVRALRRLRSDVVFVGRASAASDLDWQGLELASVEVATRFGAVFGAVSDALLRDNPAPDVTELDQAIAKLRIAIEKGPDHADVSHRANVLPFVIDTLRRDLGDLIDACAAGGGLSTG